jgi:hypothetical protein
MTTATVGVLTIEEAQRIRNELADACDAIWSVASRLEDLEEARREEQWPEGVSFDLETLGVYAYFTDDIATQVGGLEQCLERLRRAPMILVLTPDVSKMGAVQDSPSATGALLASPLAPGFQKRL